MVWFAPSVETIAGAGHVTTPEMASAHVNVTVTSPLFQPAVFGGGDTTAVIVGRAWSMLTMTLPSAVFPARSIAAPLTIWLPPPAESVIGGAHEAIPEPSSAQANVTVAF